MGEYNEVMKSLEELRKTIESRLDDCVTKEQLSKYQSMGAASSSSDKICIFLNTGHTFTFKHVSNIQDNENAIYFKYLAMSDGKIKTAVFYKYGGAVVGVSKYK